jgi:hypothetical protein
MEDAEDHELTKDEIASHAFILGAMTEANGATEEAAGAMCSEHKDIAHEVLKAYEGQLDAFEQDEDSN